MQIKTPAAPSDITLAGSFAFGGCSARKSVDDDHVSFGIECLIVIIGGPLAAWYFYRVGCSRYPSYYGPRIYRSGFCVLIAYHGWPGGCY
jgi:hypothetical protein